MDNGEKTNSGEIPGYAGKYLSDWGWIWEWERRKQRDRVVLVSAKEALKKTERNLIFLLSFSETGSATSFQLTRVFKLP